ncbi:MAG: Asp-tRNA(Asn)/Glu-tRNA(Gln) amidotransferase subunit GatA [Alphaproteobacteria bacterium]|nr:Asp-tRNA(Asn)/Glu-tRNA(Gln) amidotransferase subunit GatA [Alphaproteobacteria bacterium]
MTDSVISVVQGVLEGTTTAQQRVDQCATIIGDDSLNAFVTRTIQRNHAEHATNPAASSNDGPSNASNAEEVHLGDGALLAVEHAQIIDDQVARGVITRENSPLAGLPIAHKDLFCTPGVRTTAGSKMLGNFIPPYESTVGKRLREAGAVSLGKLNQDEFAMGSSTATSYFGNTYNPWRTRDAVAANQKPNLSPGGSSGGSAAAVAAGYAFAATGTDTGGSIRQPAAFCGITGVKPTYGRCSRWGVIAFASSLDQPGILARTVGDSAAVLQTMVGHDPQDATSAKHPVPDFSQKLTHGAKGLRIGIPREYVVDGMAPRISALWEQGIDWLRDQGATIVNVSLPYTALALPCYYIIAPAEASSNLARYDGVRFGYRCHDPIDLNDMYTRSRSEGFGEEVQRRLMIGTYVLSAGYYDAYYRKAQRIRQCILNDFTAAFDTCDVLLTPTTPSSAFPLDDAPTDPVVMYLNDVFTVPSSLAGLPAISVPAGLDESGLPLGLQLIAPAFAETLMFQAAAAIEQPAQFPFLPAVA